MHFLIKQEVHFSFGTRTKFKNVICDDQMFDYS